MMVDMPWNQPAKNIARFQKIKLLIQSIKHAS